MDNLKKVEKLMERADVSYEEAKAVLEECDWDVLEAVVKLESQGKLKKKRLYRILLHRRQRRRTGLQKPAGNGKKL